MDVINIWQALLDFIFFNVNMHKKTRLDEIESEI